MKKGQTGISINVYINEALKEDEELVQMVNGNIYPVVCNQDTTFPFIVHYRDSITTDYTKCGRVGDTVNFSVEIASKKYKEGMDIAERVRAVLELKRNTYFQDLLLDSVEEFYAENTFVQRLSFTAKIL